MCRQVVCKVCNKTTWAGCGRHADEVMRDVPVAERCNCVRDEKKKPAENGGIFAKIFGR